ncbi:hypothetical protein T08_1367 [Trichinella sp. T8]|nr:hypothetical protein T08_1367 [Trichinella sp. T8]
MLLTAILVVIILALIYHFVTEKKQISEWKETRVQPMTAIPEKKTPEEIIKESKELRLKADKKQVGKTKKKTKSKKSKKAIKSIPKGTDISKEKAETDKKIETAESSPETIEAVAAPRNIIPQILPNVATEEITNASENIRREDSEKKKRKLKRKSKSKKGYEMEKEMSVKKDMMRTEKSETNLQTEVTPFQLENTAQYMEEQNIMGKKSKKKSKKQSKSTKSKKTVEDTVAEETASSQMPETDIISPKLTLDNEATAINVGQQNMVPPITEETVDKAVIKDKPQGEKKDSKKIKKKSKKRSKSKKSKKSVEDTVADEAASSQMPETDIISPKLTLDNEATAINVDQLNMVPPIAEAAVEKPVIKDEPKGEKEAPKKIKKKSKKQAKSKKSKKSVEHTVAKEAASSQMPETDIITPKTTLDNEVTAINVDQLIVVPPKAEDAVEIPKIKDEPIGEKKDSKKIKKKTKKRSKSKKSKRSVGDTCVKVTESSEMPETDIISPKLTLDNEVTAINIDQLNMVPPKAEDAVEIPKIKDEPIGEKKDSKKIKKKSKKRSKSKKSKKTVEDTVAKEAASSQMPETDIISPKLTLDNEATAINVDQLNMVPPKAEAAVEKPVIKDEPKGEKEASKKIKKKSKKRSKSKKSKKTVEDTVAKEAESSQMPETDIISPKLTLDNEATAINDAVEKPVIKDEPKGEKEASKKIKKKSKKRSKSKKSKKTVEDTIAKEATSSQMPETDIISPKPTLDNEVTAINVDQLNMFPPIADENVEKPVIKDEPKGEKKHSKKIKKKSKKRSKSRKSNKPVDDKIAK